MRDGVERHSDHEIAVVADPYVPVQFGADVARDQHPIVLDKFVNEHLALGRAIAARDFAVGGKF